MDSDKAQFSVSGHRLSFNPPIWVASLLAIIGTNFLMPASSKKRAEPPNDEVLEMVIYNTWPQGSPLRAAEITGTPVFHPAIQR